MGQASSLSAPEDDRLEACPTFPRTTRFHMRGPCKDCIPPGILRWTAGLTLPSLRAGTPAMTATPPEFAEDVRKYAGGSGRREAGAGRILRSKRPKARPAGAADANPWRRARRFARRREAD